MFNITVVTIGKIKERYFQAAFDEYAKRLKPYGIINVVELSAEPFKSGDKIRAKGKEGEKIVNFLQKSQRSKVVILDEHGRRLTSSKFAELLAPISDHIIFVIGGSLGLSDVVLNYSGSEKLALSEMTFPHELARVNLIEQVYRAVTIIKGKEYHY